MSTLEIIMKTENELRQFERGLLALVPIVFVVTVVVIAVIKFCQNLE